MLIKFEVFDKEIKIGTVLYEKSLRKLIKQFPDLTFTKWSKIDEDWIEDKKYKLSLF